MDSKGTYIFVYCKRCLLQANLDNKEMIMEGTNLIYSKKIDKNGVATGELFCSLREDVQSNVKTRITTTTTSKTTTDYGNNYKKNTNNTAKTE